MTTVTSTDQLPEGVCVLSDGGCLNNNKPIAERSMYGSTTVFNNRKQVASVLYDGRTAVQHEFEFEHDIDAQDWASNQLAELLAALEAINYAGQLAERRTKQGAAPLTITILSDSEYALGHAQTWRPDKKAHHDTITASQALKDSVRYAQNYGATLKFQHVDNVWVKSILGH